MLALMLLSLVMNLIMWIERWMILAPSLLRNYAPYGWGLKWPSLVEMLITLGALAWFTLLFLIFVKIFPPVSMYEIKEMLFEHREVSDRLVRESPEASPHRGEPRGQTA
jgi:molybdopterin-containing oxidoreductase family membrane subunit